MTTITNSMIKTHQRCTQQFHYKFEEGLVPKAQPSLPLKRGDWLHKLLEAHYLQSMGVGEGWRPKNEELKAEFMRLFEEERERFGDLPTICRDIMRSYEFHWKEIDSDLDILAVEHEFEVPLPHGHVLKGKADAIVEDEFGRWLMEHKSHRSIPKSDYRFMDMQTARYLWALNKEGWELNGILWNYIRTKPPTVPQMTKTGRVSRRRIDTDYLTMLRFIRSNHLDVRDFRDVLLRLKKHNTFLSRARVPRAPKVLETLVKDAVRVADQIERGDTPVRSISRDCEFHCEMKPLCMVELYGGNAALVRKTQYRVRKVGEYYGDIHLDPERD